MKTELTYKQIYGSDKKLLMELEPLWLNYMREIYSDDDDVKNEPDDVIKSWLYGRANIQGQREDMHFECIYLKENLAGFVLYAVDLGGIKGILDAGYGYIMELYVIPQYRRKGIASETFERVKQTLIKDGSDKAYLTPDNESGVPFWKSLGFADTGKIDPDNKMPIYMRTL
jgi:GNAT superfamily N-acetyltransferase